MTVWLRRQESVHRFGTYLQWAVPGYIAPTTSDDAEEDEDDEADGDVSDANDLPEHSDDDGEDLDETPAQSAFTVAKTPAFPGLTVASITTDFHAPAFLDNLADFLHSKSIIPRIVPANNSMFPVYKKITLSLPDIPEAHSSIRSDTIRAVEASSLITGATGIKQAKAGQFDTVLVRISSRRANEGPTDGKFWSPLSWMFSNIISRALCCARSGHFPHSRGFRPVSGTGSVC
jgi:hypothetical protein